MAAYADLWCVQDILVDTKHSFVETEMIDVMASFVLDEIEVTWLGPARSAFVLVSLSFFLFVAAPHPACVVL